MEVRAVLDRQMRLESQISLPDTCQYQTTWGAGRETAAGLDAADKLAAVVGLEVATVQADTAVREERD